MAGIRCSVVLLLHNCLIQSTKKTWNVYNTCCRARGSHLIERMLLLVGFVSALFAAVELLIGQTAEKWLVLARGAEKIFQYASTKTG